MTQGASRRGRGVARRKIVEAAAELFAANGYDGTGMRDIAARAEVDLALIYRSIGSKSEVFRLAVLDPMHDFISTFVDRWVERGETMSNEDIVHSFVSELYQLFSDNRAVMLALLSANAFSTEAGQTGNPPLSAELDRLVDMAVKDAKDRNLEHLDLDLSLRYLLGIVMALVLMDDLILPTGRRHPSKRRLINTMSTFGLAGIQATTKPPRRSRSAQENVSDLGSSLPPPCS